MKRRAETASRRPRTVGKLGQRRQIVLPKAICDQLHLCEGDPVEFDLRQGVVVLTPKKLVDAADVLTPAEEKLVRQGERELGRGKGVAWESVKKRLKL